MFDHKKTDYCDRTLEFNQCVNSYFQKTSFGHVKPKVLSEKNDPVQGSLISQHFTANAKQIIKNFDLTLQKISKMKLLVSRKPVTVKKDFSYLADVIQTDCRDSSEDLKKLKNTLNEISSFQKNQAYQHRSIIILNLQTALKSIAGELKNLIENNKDLLEIETKKDEIMIMPLEMVSKNSYSQPAFQPNVPVLNPLYEPLQQQNTLVPAPVNPLLIPFNTNSVSQYNNINFNTSQNHKSLILTDPTYANDSHKERQTTQFLQQSQQQIFAPQSSHSLFVDQEIRLRDSAMNRVEQTIVQLGEMYQQFSTLVHEQSEIVTRIDTQIDDSYYNIDAAHIQLTKFFKTISNRRQFMIKAFIFILIMFAFFAFFMF